MILLTMLLLAVSCTFIEGAGQYISSSPIENKAEAEGEEIMLPEPDKEGQMALEQAIEKRRSVRSFTDQPLDNKQISQLLWSAQGITQQPTGFRASPSAGALYPLELYLVQSEGAYQYRPQDHSIARTVSGDIRQVIASCALGQQAVAQAPVSIIITAVYDRTTVKYGERGIRYVHIEAGHACQNILLQATVLNLGAVPIGAFSDQCINEALSLDESYTPLYIVPVGHPVD
ncbi:MAG: SagB/ThcOx family dehydrogenase [Actinomycetota bacterium]